MDCYDNVFLSQLHPLVYVNYCEEFAGLEDILDLLDKFTIPQCIWNNIIIKNRISTSKYYIQKLNKTKSSITQDVLNYYKELFGHLDSSKESDPELPNFTEEGVFPRFWLEGFLKKIPSAIIHIFEVNDSMLQEEIDSLCKMRGRLKEIGINVIAIACDTTQDRAPKVISMLKNAPEFTFAHNLFYIASNPTDEFHRNCDIIVSSISSSLKGLMYSFYHSIENKVKSDNESKRLSLSLDSDSEILVKISLIRRMLKEAFILQFLHPSNLEPSIKVLESVYQEMISYLTGFENINEKDNSKTSNVFIEEISMLLDVTAFHIVKCYFSIEESAHALKKHKAHILNVLETRILNEKSSRVWVSIQYQWLAELISLIPRSLIQNLSAGTVRKKYNRIKSSYFFGGVEIEDSYIYDLITNPGLLFLKCESELHAVSDSNLKIGYLHLNFSKEVIFERRLMNLQNAIDFFRSTSEIENKFLYTSLMSYTEWRIAESFFTKNDKVSYIKALPHYENSINEYARKNPFNIILNWRLAQCHEAIGSYEKMLFCLLRTLEDPFSWKSQSFKISDNSFYRILDLKTVDATSLGNSFKLVSLNCTLVGSKENNVITNTPEVYDSLLCQIQLRPNKNALNLGSLLESKDGSLGFSIKVKRITVNLDDDLTGDNDLIFNLVEDDTSHPSETFQTSTITNTSSVLKGYFNINFNKDFIQDSAMKVLEIRHIFTRAGNYSVKSVVVESELTIAHSEKSLSVSVSNIFKGSDLNHNENQNFKEIYFPSNQKLKLSKKVIKTERLKRLKQTNVNVMPYFPKFSIELTDKTLNSIVLNETVNIPLSLKHTDNKNGIKDFSSIQLFANAKLFNSDDKDLTSSFTIHCYWQGQKDDESLNLGPLIEDSKQINLNLIMHITRLNLLEHQPEFLQTETLKLVIFGNLLFNNDSEDTFEKDGVTHEISKLRFDFVLNPFECSANVYPRYRSFGHSDMPCPFVLDLHTSNASTEKGNNNSMPIVSRLWEAELLFKDFTFSKSTIELISVNLKFVSSRSDVLIELVDEQKLGDNSALQLFSTTTKTGYYQRTLKVGVECTFEWKRKNSQKINTYKNNDLDFSLPLGDPRALVSVKHQNNFFHIKYILENPTPRIFVFSTSLLTDDESANGWSFSDSKNIIPITNSTFPILPFNRHVMEYTGVWKGSESDSIPLPQFNVTDVTYKVSLAPIPITREIIPMGNSMVLKL